MAEPDRNTILRFVDNNPQSNKSMLQNMWVIIPANWSIDSQMVAYVRVCRSQTSEDTRILWLNVMNGLRGLYLRRDIYKYNTVYSMRPADGRYQNTDIWTAHRQHVSAGYDNK